MAKKIDDINQKTVDYILGSIGFIFPRTENELDNFNKLYPDSEFDLTNYNFNPDRILNTSKKEFKRDDTKIKFENTQNTYFKRIVLAAEIASHLYNEPTFGSVKFQKLVFLCENIQGMNINYQYSKQAAGPYDNKFMHGFSKAFEKQRWFEVKKEKINNYTKSRFIPLEKIDGHKQYYAKYFSETNEKIQWFIDTFRKEKTDWVELIATLYACWMELKEKGKFVNDDALLLLLYNWSVEKKKYPEERALLAISWMKKNNVIPFS